MEDILARAKSRRERANKKLYDQSVGDEYLQGYHNHGDDDGMEKRPLSRMKSTKSLDKLLPCS